MRRGRLVLVAGLALGAVAATAVALAVVGGREGELLPDLDQAAPTELGSRTVRARNETRFLLGFDSAAGNVGDGPLLVVGSRPSRRQARMNVVQRIESTDGSIRAVAVRAQLLYVRSADHSHWHMLDFMQYELRRADGRLVAPDRKTGFCLGDRYEIQLELGRAAPDPVFTGECGRGRPDLLRLEEGISVGYGDDYAAYLEGQNFDVTGLPAGRYLLVHRVNSRRALRESDYSNNAASMAFELAWPGGTRRPPSVRILGRCPDSATCS